MRYYVAESYIFLNMAMYVCIIVYITFASCKAIDVATYVVI